MTFDRRYIQQPAMKNDTNYFPQQMQPNPPNQSPEEKPSAVGFKTDEEWVIFFQTECC